MEAQLRAFLSSCRVSKGDLFTHTTKSTGVVRGTKGQKGWSSGNYYIENDQFDNFWTVYCNAVRRKVWCTLTEKPEAYFPLHIDFDFKSSLDDGFKRWYNNRILKELVRLYQEEIREIVHPDHFEEKMLWCIVLEKPEPRIEQGSVKDGFHFHFPHFICDGWIQDIHLRNKVAHRMVKEGIWKNKKGDVPKFFTPLDQVIDTKMAKKPWMMYGSMNYKGKHSLPYLYNSWEGIPESKRYGYAFNHNLKIVEIEKIFEEEMIGRKNSLKYYLPRFMSIRGFVSPTKLRDDIETKRTSMTKRKGLRKFKGKRRIIKKRSIELVLKDIKTIKDGEIMEMLSDDRADNYDDWMEVGWTLFNMGQGCDDALNLWIDFSKRWPKFKDGECEELWGQMETRDKSIASLFYMAKHDSPNEYQKWKETQIRYDLWNSLYEAKPNEYDVSLVVCKMYGDRFICADAKKDIWYQFIDHRWRMMDDSISLKSLFVDEVLKKYVNLRQEIHNDIGDSERRLELGCSEDEVNDIKKDMENKAKKKKKCTAIITALKTCTFHDKLLKMCKLKMHNSEFLKKIDENHNLLGCENGVLDLELETFRDGRPDDYITFSTGIYYREYRDDDDEVRELDDYLLKVYPNKNRRKYFLDFTASCLQGGNVNKRFLIATGKSDGAKSITFALLELAFGTGSVGYFGKFPREVMVQKTGSNSSAGARPELARVRGKRIMGCQEITHRESINIGFLKEATGNDSFFARGMYEKGTEITPQFTLMLQCNSPPAIPGHDEATWSRIRVLDHESKFVKPQDKKRFPVPETFEKQLKMKRFPADPQFRQKLPELAPVLLWKLFQTYKKYKKEGLQEPKEVMVSTDRYQADNDIYKQFIQDRIEKISRKKLKKNEKLRQQAYLRLADVYSEFKDWYRDNYPGYKTIGKNIMKKELTKRLGTIKNRKTDYHGFGKLSRWWGYQFNQEDDEDGGFQQVLGKK